MGSRIRRKMHGCKNCLSKDSAYALCRRLKEKGEYCRTYKCPYCKGYHLARDKAKSLEAAFSKIEQEQSVKTLT